MRTLNDLEREDAAKQLANMLVYGDPRNIEPFKLRALARRILDIELPEVGKTVSPGPWTYHRGMGLIVDGNQKRIASIFAAVDSPTTEANGYLLAAARELRPALIQVKDCLEEIQRRQDIDRGMTKQVMAAEVAARSALARSIGEGEGEL